MGITIQVLGSSAGGGFPQWNCLCPNCKGIREGKIKSHPRKQSSLAISENGRDWTLLNVSPDVVTQLESFPPLRPANKIRDTGLSSIVLLDAQLDHTTGLLLLREGLPMQVYCTDMVYQELTTHHPILRTLGHYCEVNRYTIPINGSSFYPFGQPNLAFTAIPVQGKAPPYSPFRDQPPLGTEIALKIEDKQSGAKFMYAPNVGQLEESLIQEMESCDLLMYDGTFWQNDELSILGISQKTALSMGHLPLYGGEGSLPVLKKLKRPRIILTHINNTNPILREDSWEHGILKESGIELAYDGMTLGVGQ